MQVQPPITKPMMLHVGHDDKVVRAGVRCPVEMARRLTSILLFLACAPCLSVAHAAERVDDAANLYQLDQYASAAADLERELLTLIEAASDDERYYLYWTYNHLTGSWVHVEHLRTQLELSAVAQSHSGDESIAMGLRDQAQFVDWDLGRSISDLEQNAPEVKRLKHLWINEALRSLFVQMRPTVDRVWADQCARMPCVALP
jgi:hypothetical protein